MGNDKKNIILISDQKGACVDSLIATGLYNIKLIVVPYKKNVEYLKEKYGEAIESYVYYIPDTNKEFQVEFYTNYNLTYDEIEKYRDVQLKCYRYNTRYLYDDNMNNCVYYTALKFLLKYINENKIDIVFSRIMEHGAISDSLIFEIAKKNSIPVYIMSMNTGFNSDGLVSVLDYNNNIFVDISRMNNKQVNVDGLLLTLNKNYSNNNLAKFPFSKILKKFFLKKDKTFIGCIKWFYEYRIKFYLKNIKYSLMKDLYNIREETSIWQMIKGRFYLNRLKRYYKKISIKKAIDVNYIFYPLHMEPEAANLARATMGCQLFIIEQISQMLPKGYYLYIKEHPDQYASIQMDKYYYKGLKNFRNINFYKRIAELPNVRIMDIYAPSSNLISGARAVVSIAGSALIEAVAKNKPIIVFGDGTSFVELLKDAYVIEDFGILQNVLNSISNGFEPDYNDFKEIMDKYVLSIMNSEFYGVNDTLVELFKLLYISQ